MKIVENFIEDKMENGYHIKTYIINKIEKCNENYRVEYIYDDDIKVLRYNKETQISKYIQTFDDKFIQLSGEVIDDVDKNAYTIL